MTHLYLLYLMPMLSSNLSGFSHPVLNFLKLFLNRSHRSHQCLFIRWKKPQPPALLTGRTERKGEPAKFTSTLPIKSYLSLSIPSRLILCRLLHSQTTYPCLRPSLVPGILSPAHTAPPFPLPTIIPYWLATQFWITRIPLIPWSSLFFRNSCYLPLHV